MLMLGPNITTTSLGDVKPTKNAAHVGIESHLTNRMVVASVVSVVSVFVVPVSTTGSTFPISVAVAFTPPLRLSLSGTGTTSFTG